MAVTPGGNFYIESSNLVANYPATSLAIANRLDKYALNPYTDAIERDFLIQFPVQGQIAQTLDDNVAWKYDGTAWNILSGAVLQVVRATDTTQLSTTSTSFVDITGLTVTITPTVATSAVLLICSVQGSKAVSNEYVELQITDNSNVVISGAEDTWMGTGGATNQSGVMTIIGYATPATTTATTYKARFSSNNGNAVTIENAQNTGQLYAIEVAA
jgi:hypothetical protein